MDLKLDDALRQAIDAHNAGQMVSALGFYETVLVLQPNHSDANHNIGVVFLALGQGIDALSFFKNALKSNGTVERYWLSYIEALIKLDLVDHAQFVLDQAKKKGAEGKGVDDLAILIRKIKTAETTKVFWLKNTGTVSAQAEPSQSALKSLMDPHCSDKNQQTLCKLEKLLQQFPNSATLHYLNGAANLRIGQFNQAILSYQNAVKIKPNYAEAFNGIGLALKNKGYPDEALSSYKKAINIKSDYAEAFNNIGNAFNEIGDLENAIDSYDKAINIKPNYADALNNLGNALRDTGEIDLAINSYEQSINTHSGNPGVYCNLANALVDKGDITTAITKLKEAIKIRPTFGEAHRLLSKITQYRTETDHFNLMLNQYKTKLSDHERCSISFALAKAHDDLKQYDKAFQYLHEGNSLRRKLVHYNVDLDKNLFTCLKNSQPSIMDYGLKIEECYIETVPVFILGMPRSGTSLVEQIISSHVNVTAAGELEDINFYGRHLSFGSMDVTKLNIENFRQQYLFNLKKHAKGLSYVTDKMPLNFRHIPLICAAFPEAKIIHVERESAAICWSNYKHYFIGKGLGYSDNIKDVVTYYKLYKDLMSHWLTTYHNRIYRLNYEKLTTEQEKETRRLIEYLELEWDRKCLAPQDNNRAINTASHLQIREKVYKNSSQQWRKYEPFIDGEFDELKT